VSSSTPSKARQHFSLNKIAAVVDSYQKPEAPFDPHGDYTHTYALCTILGGNFGEEGELRLRRTRVEDGTAVLEVDVRREGTSNFHHFTTARILSRNDQLSSPISWEWSTKIAPDADAPGLLFTGLSRSGSANENGVAFEGKEQPGAPLPGAYTTEYSLFDAVQRLAGPFDPVQFTHIDRLDAVQPDHTLRYEGEAQIDLAGQPQTLRAYTHLGPGILPAVYWVEESGRLLFVLVGQEVYVLKEAAGQPARFAAKLTLEPPLKEATSHEPALS
jgi:hypothetical protein